MNTNPRELLLQSLLKNLMTSSGNDNVFALAEYAYNTKAAIAEDTPIYSDDYQSLMQDFQGKCDELATLQGTYEILLEQHNKTKDTLGQMHNSMAALQRDYEQLTQALSLQNSEFIELRAQLVTAKEEVDAKEMQLADLEGRYNFMVRDTYGKNKADLAEQLLNSLRVIGLHLGAGRENASTIADWVKQNVPAGTHPYNYRGEIE